MIARLVQLGIGVAVVLVVGAVIYVQPGDPPAQAPPPAPIDAAEHEQTIEAMRPTKRDRPVIAILAHNEATEITDLLVPYGVLRRADVADVVVVAKSEAPIRLFPISRFGAGPELFTINPQRTLAAFDASYPEGADYVIVPAVLPRDDQALLEWLRDQRRRGAAIVSVCAGAMTAAAAGLLEDRRATTHWSYAEDLREAEPRLHWVGDRRFVAHQGVVTTTGISASAPVTISLVEAIAGRERAQQLAAELGADHWGSRHRSAAFQLTQERRKTFLRNWLSFWRRDTIGAPMSDGVDEIALALTVDAYSRTALAHVVVIANAGTASVRTMHDLVIRPSSHVAADDVDHMLAPPQSLTPGRTLERVLPAISRLYGEHTADIVALQMEYEWRR